MGEEEGGFADTDTMFKERHRERDPNIKIAVLYNLFCSPHALSSLQLRETIKCICLATMHPHGEIRLLHNLDLRCADSSSNFVASVCFK